MVASESFRLVFFGTPGFSVATLEQLLASRHHVVAVVTQPDRPSGRGQQLTDSPVKARARLAGVPVLQPATLKDGEFVSRLKGFTADLGIVVAYGKILPEPVIAAPRLGMLNVHASLLPRYRGAAPVHRAVIAGERETGVTIMRVVKALDAGPMLAKGYRPIDDNETSEEVERDLSTLGASLLLWTLDRVADGSAVEVAQDEAEATYAARLTREDGVIEWSRPALQIHNLIRGLHPWPHAHSYLRGQRVIFLRSEPSEDPSPAPPGVVATARGSDFGISTGDRVLRVLACSNCSSRESVEWPHANSWPAMPSPAATASRRRHDRARAHRGVPRSARRFVRPQRSAFGDRICARLSGRRPRPRALHRDRHRRAAVAVRARPSHRSFLEASPRST
jgi:methionyl-tRNA formyltransferase